MSFTFSFSLSAKCSLIICLVITAGHTTNTEDVCNDLAEVEHLCLAFSLGVTNITSQDDIDEFNRSQPSDEMAQKMTDLCSPSHACTLEFTKCILPAFKENCENNPTLIRMCKNFHIHLKQDENDQRVVCV
uniref:DUF19 domain-containing protein n=1 Tax=Trichobilharzia regenti TaxID=157069 RepID=A0AA85JP25_TRIRE|nr:unnamed protein product [Trichobilharzia regenti]